MKWDVVIPGLPAAEPNETRHPVHSASYRALFLSDLHLGARAFQAEALLEFLKHNDADTIYLVGDIIDFWRMRRSPYWPQSHNDVVQKLLRKVRKGARIIYVPGNHDEALREYCGTHFGGIELHRDFIHTTADGRRFLVIHGDEFDVVVRYAQWLAFLGDRSYELLLWCNHPLNWARRRLGFGYWSLSAFLKHQVKQAVNFMGEFEEALTEEAERLEVDGIICGHIHRAANHKSGNIQYVNCGDWVESCTAIAEDHDGQLHLINWPKARESIAIGSKVAVNATANTSHAPEMTGSNTKRQNSETGGVIG
jgi:UDP-2,3-diacylglucosamine pyrophosphatase LpxH